MLCLQAARGDLHHGCPPERLAEAIFQATEHLVEIVPILFDHSVQRSLDDVGLDGNEAIQCDDLLCAVEDRRRLKVGGEVKQPMIHDPLWID